MYFLTNKLLYHIMYTLYILQAIPFITFIALDDILLKIDIDNILYWCVNLKIKVSFL